jgi:hypothetical protein
VKTFIVITSLLVSMSAAVAISARQTRQSGDSNNEPSIASVTGKWVLMGTGAPEPVKIATPVTNESDCIYGDGGSVVLERPNLERPNASQLIPFSCDAPHHDALCNPDPKIPDIPKMCSVKIYEMVDKSGIVNSIKLSWQQIMNRLHENPEKYIMAASRGLEPDLSEAVVPLNGSQIDVSAAFKDMPDGEYWVTLAPVGGAVPAGHSVRLSYKQAMPAMIIATGISPRLYNLILVDQTDSPAGSEAWILVRSQQNYNSASTDFGELVAQSAKWPEQMDPSASRAILRAYLEQLADAPAGGK